MNVAEATRFRAGNLRSARGCYGRIVLKNPENRSVAKTDYFAANSLL